MKLSAPIRILALAISTLLGVAALLGWGLMAAHTLDVRATLAQTLSDLEAARTKDAYSDTIRSLLRDTSESRTALAALAARSPIEIVDAIEAAAETANVEITIDAIEERMIEVPPVKNVPAYAVTVSGSDSFARMYRFVSLLSLVPMPSVLDHVSLESGGADGAWSLRARVIVFSESAQ